MRNAFIALLLIVTAGAHDGHAQSQRFSRIGVYTTWNNFFDDSRMMDLKWFAKNQDVKQSGIGLNLEVAFGKKHSLAVDGSFYKASYGHDLTVDPQIDKRKFFLARGTYIRSWRPLKFFRLGGKLGGTYRKGSEELNYLNESGVATQSLALSDVGVHTGAVVSLRLFRRLSLQADLDYTFYVHRADAGASPHHLGLSAGLGFAF